MGIYSQPTEDQLSNFPCQHGDASSFFTKIWKSHALEIDLRQDPSSLRARDGESLKTLVNLTFATVVWAYTGDVIVRFLSSTLDEHTIEHLVYKLHVTKSLTINEAARMLGRCMGRQMNKGSTALSDLVFISHEASLESQRPFDETPLQVFCQLDTENVRIKFMVWYNQAFVKEFHIRSISQHLCNYLKSIWETNWNNRLVNLETLTEDDVQHIKALNSTPLGFDYETIHECIRQKASESPDETAIDSWDGRFSRIQLEDESEQLAVKLLETGISAGGVVSVIMNKSKWVPVSLLAVLKAGAAILLLEPTLPLERLKIMITEAEVTHAITSHEFSSLACSLVPTVMAHSDHGEFLVVDSEARQRSMDLPTTLPSVSPDAVAILSFTSGSSGNPKAVVIQHCAWVTKQTRTLHLFGVTEGTRVFQYASYSFLVSIVDTLGMLLVGAIVCIPSADERNNDLNNAVQRLAPQHICITPSASKILDPEKVTSIKSLLFTGEPVQKSSAERWLATGKVTVRHGYGLSEGCGTNSAGIVSKSSESYRGIGQSACRYSWIVDPVDHDRLMPVGALGELILEGYNLAKGYLNAPEKMAEVFIPNPRWAPDPSAGTARRWWYKTGDLAQYQESGDLFLFGRKDAQLKFHGQRVEASEIEHHIMQAMQDQISQVAVDKIVSNADDEKLVAFVTLHEENCEQKRDVVPPIEQQLRSEMIDRLKSTVPLWMIPASVILVEAMPRTATGKLDRRSIRSLYGAQVTSPKTWVAANVQPNSTGRHGFDTETSSFNFATLKSLWKQSLKINENQLYPDSQWVEVGGDSLSAMLLVRDARAAGFQLSTADLLSGKPLIELSRCMEPRAPFSREINGSTEHSDQIVRYSHPITDFQRAYLPNVDGRTKGTLHERHMLFRGKFDLQRLKQAVNHLIKNTEALRLTVTQNSSTTFSQKVISSESNEWKTRCQTHQNDAKLPLGLPDHDFRKDPVLFLFEMSGAQNEELKDIKLILLIDHIVIDGMSVDYLIQDLLAAYRGEIAKTPRPSFIDYLHKHLTKRSSDSFAYWSNLLKDSAPTKLRGDLENLVSAKPNQKYFHPSASRILCLAQPSKSASMSTLVKSAWSIVVSCMSGRSDILFLYLMHNRDEDIPGSHEIIGCCVSEIPLRVQLYDSMSCPELLDVVQEQVIASMRHAQLGSSTIAANCTNWPFKERWYQHSTYLLYQNVHIQNNYAVGSSGYLNMEEVKVHQEMRNDFDLTAQSSVPGELHFKVTYQEGLYTAGEASAVAEGFTQAVRMLLDGQATIRDIQDRIYSVHLFPIVKQ